MEKYDSSSGESGSYNTLRTVAQSLVGHLKDISRVGVITGAGIAALIGGYSLPAHASRTDAPMIAAVSSMANSIIPNLGTDSDGDGLSDDFENDALGINGYTTNPNSVSSNGYGFHDNIWTHGTGPGVGYNLMDYSQNVSAVAAKAGTAENA